ncbi:MAG TPA: diacylglycerol kinase family lipid kinase [Fimbriimonadaceae bacterium]|nr:diacylglycerol kinase family lipid kinase [Fimbriimonadaceae bacterium]
MIYKIPTPAAPDSALLILNPAAGKGKQDVPLVGEHILTVETEEPGHATVLAAAAVAAGWQRIIVGGGDGTLNEVVQSVAGTDVTLGLWPVGTANDYARSAGLPTDLTAALDLAASGPGTPVDLARVNGKHYCVNLGGLGFDAEVVRRYHAAGPVVKALGTKARYWSSIGRTFLGFRGLRATITFDDEPPMVVPKLMLLAFGPARQYGEGMRMCPDAVLNDGLLDAVWAESLSAVELSKLLPLVYEAKHIGHPKVKSRTFRRMRIDSVPAGAFHLEGDLKGESPLEVEVVPGALRMVLGPGAAVAPATSD